MSDQRRTPALVAHADWSTSDKKRFICIGLRDIESRTFRVEAPQRLDTFLGERGSGETPARLHELPALLARLARGEGALFALDMPIGLPRAFASRGGASTFRELLDLLLEDAEAAAALFSPAETPEEISWSRPFYPQRAKGARRQHLLDGLKLEDWSALYRACDLPVSGGPSPCPIFWMVGANQVGKGAISGWRDLLLPCHRACELVLWPFDGELFELFEQHPEETILTEAYPAEVYGWLELDWTTQRGGKRSQAARCAQAASLLSALDRVGAGPSAALREAIEEGFGDRADGEDRFDAFVGTLGLLFVLCGERKLHEPEEEEIRALEGWIIGRGPNAKRRHVRSAR